MPNDPSTYYFTQGVLGVTVLVLAIVIIKLYNSRESDRKEWRAEVKELNNLRLEDSKEVTRDVTTVVSGNSQNMALLSEKIASAKQQGQS